jgi:hypothetical protein
MPTAFPQTARRDDQQGHMVVQRMLWYLRDTFDKNAGSTAQGDATVTNGNTTVSVSHGLANVISVNVQVTPISNPSGLLWWVSGRTPTAFVINLSAAAPVAGVQFNWQAKGV